MGTFVARAQALALAFGAPGLFVVAFLDSSFLSLPEVNDILVVWMVIQHKTLMPLYASAAVLGSLVGCLVMYYIGRKGGDALVRKRFKGATVDKALGTFQRYGVMAVLIPSLLPPPAPFKIFVLLAGVAGITVPQFSIALIIGRGIRYFGLGFLALRYGDQTLAYMHEHGRDISLGLVGLLAVGMAAFFVWQRLRAGRSDA